MADGIGGRASAHFINNMAAVNAGNEMTDLNKPPQSETEGKVDKNGVEETEIPLSPDHAAEEARKEEIRAKIRTVSCMNRKDQFLRRLSQETVRL